jgi:hypothetical protein
MNFVAESEPAGSQHEDREGGEAENYGTAEIARRTRRDPLSPRSWE